MKLEIWLLIGNVWRKKTDSNKTESIPAIKNKVVGIFLLDGRTHIRYNHKCSKEREFEVYNFK